MSKARQVKAPPAGDRPLKTLDRVLSKMGAGSRVDAQRWIRAGRVKVNGQVVRDPDRWLDLQRDRVRLDGKPLTARERVYLLLYKPTGYLTTYRDPQGRPTVHDLIADVGAFLSPVGRLDLDTSGLLLMPNDNQLAERVPSLRPRASGGGRRQPSPVPDDRNGRPCVRSPTAARSRSCRPLPVNSSRDRFWLQAER